MMYLIVFALGVATGWFAASFFFVYSLTRDFERLPRPMLAALVKDLERAKEYLDRSK